MSTFVRNIIVSELIKMKRENIKLQKENKKMSLELLSFEVSTQINEWLDKPYHGKSEKQDIQDFALQITRFIASKVIAENK